MVLKIKAEDEMGARIFLDDKELKAVTNVEIFLTAGKPHYATITFMPEKIDFEGDVNVCFKKEILEAKSGNKR